MKKLLLFVCLALHISAFSQKADCSSLVNESMAKYSEKDYLAALDLFKKAVKGKCPLTDADYYNGACIASLLKLEDQTFAYLEKAVNLGWDNIAHMDKDTDLDGVRADKRYAEMVQKIRDRFNEILVHLKGMTVQDLDKVIPYVENGKWGWIDRMTASKFTRPVFDYTDFRTSSGLVFYYKSKKYLLNNDFSITPIPNRNNVPVGLAPHELGQGTPPAEGFIAEGNRIVSISPKYKSVTLIHESGSSKRIGIATNLQDRKGIVHEDGTVLNGFDFYFSDIGYFRGRNRNTFLIAKKTGEEHYLVYDRAGKLVYDKPFHQYHQFDNYQRTPQTEHIYVGGSTGDYLLVYQPSKKVNVLDQQTLKTVFKRDYDRVLLVNGPTQDKDRSGSVFSQGIIEAYFLVQDGKKMFYVDGNGREYLAR